MMACTENVSDDSCSLRSRQRGCLRKPSLRARYSPYPTSKHGTSSEQSYVQQNSCHSDEEQQSPAVQLGSEQYHCQQRMKPFHLPHQCSAAPSQATYHPVPQPLQYSAAWLQQQQQVLAQLQQQWPAQQEMVVQHSGQQVAYRPRKASMINLAITLCARALDSTLQSFQTAQQLCMVAPHSFEAMQALKQVESSMEITIRRLRLAQKVAVAQHIGLLRRAGIVPRFAAAAAGPAAAVAVPSPAAPGARAVSVAAAPARSAGAADVSTGHALPAPPLQQQEGGELLDVQEEVGSSWEC